MQPLPSDIYTRLIDAKRWMDEYYHEEIQLEQIAAKAYLSVFHFHRLFSKTYSITPHQYLTIRRLAEAKRLLAAGEYPVISVCREVGFRSAASFSSLFRKYEGITPILFQKKSREHTAKSREQPASVIPACFLAHYCDK
jgi:AraC-like DNA-binding protein